MRKGYSSEYAVRQKLIKEYGKQGFVKVAIGQNAPDYLILNPLKAIEVKSTRGKKYYPTRHDREQFELFKEWSKKNRVKVEYWIRIGRKWRILSLDEFGRKYLTKEAMS